MPEAATNLEVLEKQNKEFNNSFVKAAVELESVIRTKAAEATGVAPRTKIPATLPQPVPCQPSGINNRWKTEEATE